MTTSPKRPFDWCQNQRPWMTLNSNTAQCIAAKMRLSKPTTEICMKIDPYCQSHKYRPMTLVSGDIRFMRLFAEFPWAGSVKRQWCCRQWQFSAFSRAISSETSQMRPALLHSDTQSFVIFSAIPKRMTLNDLEWLFRVKF